MAYQTKIYRTLPGALVSRPLPLPCQRARKRARTTLGDGTNYWPWWYCFAHPGECIDTISSPDMQQYFKNTPFTTVAANAATGALTDSQKQEIVESCAQQLVTASGGKLSLADARQECTKYVPKDSANNYLWWAIGGVGALVLLLMVTR